ncbi:alpha/beta hydrolase family protein [Sutcliffiella rhizosphaerae]|uniref:2-succinyl-6-hydroxy-2, 4-cyclohexadiene-1-carboxylate synthase n=1 Tax=Sutcliffiella rhizosphaerae TaxID=2880967 RepID=A0ABM8YRL2_9BACI|nr:alpha/beta fold hydrolase [Sutcliffiella rhizosphaerae]CAG9622468.1 2-succinyl-6-hydroxy-2, 4-cyclohexadiene-1-carboxylate synthase [Sutcliffiella rhizosphaerae]
MRKHTNLLWKDINLSVSIDYPASYFANTYQKSPAIIICHGFIGSKVGVNRLFVKACEELKKIGYVVVRFDYAGCGESEGHYGKNTLRGFIEQTKEVLNFVKSLDKIDSNQLTLIGHSLGGAIATICSVNEENVKRLILWSAVGNPYKDIQIIMSRETTNIHDYYGYTFHTEFFESLKEANPIKLCSFFKGDVLIIHGDADEDIPVQYAALYEKDFLSRSLGTCNRFTISEADHTFSRSDSFKKLIGITKDWLLDGYLQKKTM